MKDSNIKVLSLKIQNLLIYYFICSILGWIMEVLYAYSVFGTFVDRGFLYGPMCPIYGWGAVTMVLITEKIRKKKVNTLGIFLIVTAIFTTLEYLTSLFLELIFNLRWWDYSNYFLNINGRVCLIFSIFFGFIGIVFVKKIYPRIQKLIKNIRKKISVKMLWVILVSLVVISNVDCVFSSIKYIKKDANSIDDRVIIQEKVQD